MKVKCHQLSRAGAVRDHNEDFLLFWEPEEFERAQQLGSIALLADGVGGESHGDVASRLAAETALAAFKESPAEASSAAVARQIFDAAAAKVFQAAQENGRMSTTGLDLSP
jgi:protein phosphatase